MKTITCLCRHTNLLQLGSGFIAQHHSSGSCLPTFLWENGSFLHLRQVSVVEKNKSGQSKVIWGLNLCTLLPVYFWHFQILTYHIAHLDLSALLSFSQIFVRWKDHPSICCLHSRNFPWTKMVRYKERRMTKTQQERKKAIIIFQVTYQKLVTPWAVEERIELN